MSKKKELACELTRLWYIILSKTSNYFLTITREQEREWERTFTANSMKKYTAAQLQAEIDKARVFL